MLYAVDVNFLLNQKVTRTQRFVIIAESKEHAKSEAEMVAKAVCANGCDEVETVEVGITADEYLIVERSDSGFHLITHPDFYKTKELLEQISEVYESAPDVFASHTAKMYGILKEDTVAVEQHFITGKHPQVALPSRPLLRK